MTHSEQIVAILDRHLKGSVLWEGDYNSFYQESVQEGYEPGEISQVLQSALKSRKAVFEKELMETAEQVIYPRIADDLFLDLEEESISRQQIQQQFQLTEMELNFVVEGILAKYDAQSANCLRPECEGVLYGYIQQNQPREVAVQNTVDWMVREFSISDVEGVEELAEEVYDSLLAYTTGAHRAPQVGQSMLSQSHSFSAGQSYSSLSVPGQGHPSGQYAGLPNTSAVFGSPSATGNSINPEEHARKLLDERVGNDKYLDKEEENEYFLLASQQCGMNTEEAERFLERYLALQGATRESTAIEEFRSILKDMMDDCYLDEMEYSNAFEQGEELGLHRAEDNNLIEKLIEQELKRNRAITEMMARDHIRDFFNKRLQSGKLTKEDIPKAADNVLQYYRLAHIEEAREQCHLLANSIAELEGFHVQKKKSKTGRILFLFAAAVLACTYLYAIDPFGFFEDTVDAPPSLAKASMVLKRLAKRTSPKRSLVKTCKLSGGTEKKALQWIENAKSAYETNRYTTPVESNVNLWTRRVKELVQRECPNMFVGKNPLVMQAHNYRLKARNWYIRRGDRRIRMRKRKEACIWYRRAAIFSTGEVLEMKLKEHCPGK